MHGHRKPKRMPRAALARRSKLQAGFRARGGLTPARALTLVARRNSTRFAATSSVVRYGGETQLAIHLRPADCPGGRLRVAAQRG